MKLELKKFDMSSIGYNKIIVFIGSRGTGKSVLLMDYLYHHRDIPVTTIISPTEEANETFSKVVPSLFIHDEYTPELIENVVKRQKIITKRKNKDIAMYGKSNIDTRSLLVLDDCMYDSSWQKDKNIRYLFFNGRHVSLGAIFTMQYIFGLNPSFRSNVDYVFICREPILSNRKRIFENYAGVFGNFDVFCSVLDQCSNNHECLVIANTVKSNNLSDIIYWYKAEINNPPFKIGSRELWALSDEYCKDSDDNDSDYEELFDQTAFRKKSKGPAIKVKKTYA